MENDLKIIAAKYIMGSIDEVTLVGDPMTIVILREAIQSSKELMIALRSGSVDSVGAALEKKRLAVSRYEKITGKIWGL